MTVPSLSSREAHLLGDVIEDAARAATFLGPLTAEALAADLKTFYAVRGALQNVAEACVQVDAGARGARFAVLFPGEDLRAIRLMGNAFRHDYGGTNPGVLRNDVHDLAARLSRRAEEILAGHRRARGRTP